MRQEIRRPLSFPLNRDELLFQKEILRDERLGATRPEQPDPGADHLDEKNEADLHQNESTGRRLSRNRPVAKCLIPGAIDDSPWTA